MEITSFPVSSPAKLIKLYQYAEGDYYLIRLIDEVDYTYVFECVNAETDDGIIATMPIELMPKDLGNSRNYISLGDEFLIGFHGNSIVFYYFDDDQGFDAFKDVPDQFNGQQYVTWWVA